jgi:hypothetical protein
MAPLLASGGPRGCARAWSGASSATVFLTATCIALLLSPGVQGAGECLEPDNTFKIDWARPCRPKSGFCDRAEFCDGSGPDCPPEDVGRNGRPCTAAGSISGVCQDNLCQQGNESQLVRARSLAIEQHPPGTHADIPPACTLLFSGPTAMMNNGQGLKVVSNDWTYVALPASMA